MSCSNVCWEQQQVKSCCICDIKIFKLIVLQYEYLSYYPTQLNKYPNIPTPIATKLRLRNPSTDFAVHTFLTTNFELETSNLSPHFAVHTFFSDDPRRTTSRAVPYRRGACWLWRAVGRAAAAGGHAGHRWRYCWPPGRCSSLPQSPTHHSET